MKAVRPALLVLLFAAGCVAPPEKQASSPAPSAGAPAPAATALSYGMVNARVKEGQTTQAELIELFGAPNITTRNTDGGEVWVYEASSTTAQSSSESESRAARLGAFFGGGDVGDGSALGGAAGGSASADNRKSATQSSYSSRTLTVIVKFNRDGTVASFSTRATNF